MTVPQAIEKSVAGGWKNLAMKEHVEFMQKHNLKLKLIKSAVAEALLDPDFWRALAKTEGWNKDFQTHLCSYNAVSRIGNADDCEFCEGQGDDDAYWKDKWHRLIDHLADGGSIEGFFETL